MRVKGKGNVSLDAPVIFRFDGIEYTGFAGDSLASALLGSGVHACYLSVQNVSPFDAHPSSSLVSILRNGQIYPDQCPDKIQLYCGLDAYSQNAGGAMKRNSVKALGTLPNQRHKSDCDVLIIGAGPAGLMAAKVAASSGADVIIVDENAVAGGSLNGETFSIDGMPGADWAAKTAAELKTFPNVRMMLRTTVSKILGKGVFAATQRASPSQLKAHDFPFEASWELTAKRTILASGAVERAQDIPITGDPCLFLASTVRRNLNQFGVIPGQRVAVFGNSDDAHRTANDLAKAGVNVSALIDSRPDAQALGDFPFYSGAQILGVKSQQSSSEVRISMGSETLKIETDCLAVSGGWNPSLNLACSNGARPIWNDEIQTFIPHANMVPMMDFAGAALGVFSTKGAFKSGIFRARKALEAIGIKPPSMKMPIADDSGNRTG